MRFATPLACAVVASAVIAACATKDKSITGHGDHGVPLPTLSKVNDPSRVDTAGTADLIVDEQATAQHWVVRDEKLEPILCSVEEGNITPGLRRIIRFTVTTPNIGDGDVFVGSPLRHMDPNGDGNFADADGMFEFAQCHNHYHFRNYAIYKLIDARTGQVWKAAKRGFCMLDTDPNPAKMGEPPAGDRNYYNCGTKNIDGFQGVSHGWGDTYVFKLGGQYFVLDGGDGQPVVPPGDYYIEVTVNPPYTPEKGKACPLVTDPATGLCHNFRERNYANNTMRTLISIPSHPGRDGVGPEKGYTITAADDMKKPW